MYARRHCGNKHDSNGDAVHSHENGMRSLFLTCQLMHPRNPYDQRPPDFAQLARDVPELQQL